MTHKPDIGLHRRIGATPPAPWRFYSDFQRWSFLAVLFLVSTSNYIDRYIVSVVLEPIKNEFGVSDTMLGLLSGFSFSIFYAVFGLPVARWADRGNRRTIITLAVSAWSVMTVICGLTQTFLQLALARVGVGVGESGAIPPAQSLITDYFPPERRATAIAVFSSAGMAGYLIGFGAGGYIAASYGWRSAFICAGLPGLLLAALSRATLNEPRLGQPTGGGQAIESLRQALDILRRKKSYVLGVLAQLFYFSFAYGAMLFVPSFLVRVLEVPLAQAGAIYGLSAAVATVFGTLSGGLVADKLSRQDVRWLAWLPALAYLTAVPFFIIAFAATDLRWFVAMAFAGNALIAAGYPVGLTAIHALCGRRRRAVAIAILFFTCTLLGGGFGPLVTGLVSDALTASYGADGLRYALIVMSSVLATSSVAFYFSGRAMPVDLEDYPTSG